MREKVLKQEDISRTDDCLKLSGLMQPRYI